jgi:hypothetical protein
MEDAMVDRYTKFVLTVIARVSYRVANRRRSGVLGAGFSPGQMLRLRLWRFDLIRGVRQIRCRSASALAALAVIDLFLRLSRCHGI